MPNKALPNFDAPSTALSRTVPYSRTATWSPPAAMTFCFMTACATVTAASSQLLPPKSRSSCV